MRKDRLKIATALGYYARATDPEAEKLAQAMDLHGLPEYRNDIDCQIAFRIGWMKADEQIEGIKGFEVDKLIHAITQMIEKVNHARNEIKSLHGRLDDAKITSTPLGLFDIGINQRIAAEERWQAPLPSEEETRKLINERSHVNDIQMVEQASGETLDKYAKILGVHPRKTLSDNVFRAEIIDFIIKSKPWKRLVATSYVGGGGAAPGASPNGGTGGTVSTGDRFAEIASNSRLVAIDYDGDDPWTDPSKE